MREEWVEAPLGAVLSQVNRIVNVSDLDEVPFAGVRWYACGVYQRPTEEASSVKTQKLNRMSSGDVTYNRMWATKAAFGVAGSDVDGCLVTNDFPLFEVDPTGASPQFIRLVLGDPQFQAAASLLATGTTERRRLKEADFLSISIMWPPIAEQRRIVDVIESVDTYIAALEERAEIARTARSALLHDLLSNPGPDWVETTFGKICSIDAQLVDPKKPEYRDLPHLAIEKIESRTGRIFPLASASDDGVISSKFLFNKNEVVYSKIRPELRKACRPGFAGLASADAYPLRPVNGCSAEFLLALILSEEFSQMAVERSARTKMPKLNRVDLFSIPVQLPPLSDQLRIAELLVDFENLETGVSAILNRSRRLRNALLSDLLSGNHEIPASYDELLAAA